MTYALYRCGCGAVGSLTIDVEERGQLACPEGCGSSYIQWRYPDGRWALTCVVGVVIGDGR